MTASIASDYPETQGAVPVKRRQRARAAHPGGPCLAAIDSLLSSRYAATPDANAVLEEARTRALQTYAAAGRDEAADRLSASLLASDALVRLSVEQLLQPEDAHDLAAQLADVSAHRSIAAAQLELFLRAVSNPLLAELPALLAVETQLRLLLAFGVVSDVSLWLRPTPGRMECVVSLGDEEPSRRMRSIAKATLSGHRPALGLARRAQIRSVPVMRWGRPDAALVARVALGSRATVQTYLAETAASLSPLLERAAVLDRSSERERQLVAGTERRLTRLGFDLHDGPIQEVIALAGELRGLRDDVYPFIADSHRESAYDRIEELAERLAGLDTELRELAHSLESRSAVSRPLEEVLHREVDAFIARTTIEAHFVVDGTCSFLTASQRIALFRAVQEALSNVREHSGATVVEIRLRARRAWTELRVEDDGHGFRVEDGLARAAKRGRLGLLGISERVRMLGGTFQLESAPGGPTRLSLTLPRWDPLDPSPDA